MSGQNPTLNEQDIVNIREITETLTTKFWNSLKFIEDRKKRARQNGLKIIGAAEGTFDVNNVLNIALLALATTLTTQSVNAGILASNRDLTSRQPVQTPNRFQFNTVGDDHVCPICDPLDGDIMTEGVNIQEPPLHENCRCFLIPLI